jgi:translation initiation factor 2 beta subunit (eIF-2beta)/eIF-5
MTRCPHCGSRTVTALVCQDGYAATCHDCGGRGPVRETETAAEQAWCEDLNESALETQED